jgi:LysM repeat protein
VSVEALCQANAIAEKHKIKPGQELWIPPRGDPDGRRTRAIHDAQAGRGARPSSRARAEPAQQARWHRVSWHRVSRGQRLGSIARRYGVSVEAISEANAIDERGLIKPGQKLIIPDQSDADGARARVVKERADRELELGAPVSGEPPAQSWRRYARMPRRKAYVTVTRAGLRFEGYLLDGRGRVPAKAERELTRLLSTRGGERVDIDERLLQLLAKVSDTFGGRTIEVVSGYRRERATAGSRHRSGRAIDFRVAGVPNTAVRDYLQTLDRVGVGYYPRSSFVHLDVRQQWTYWVDHSGPGEPARYGGVWTRPAR